VSQKKRKRIEEIFGWLKTIGGLRQTRFRGSTAHGLHLRPCRLHLIRLPKLMAKPHD
jgi:hypothetical protein